VTVQRVVVSDPALEGLSEGADDTVISEKKSYRRAQQSASYTVLEIVRPVVKVAEKGEVAAAGRYGPPATSAASPGWTTSSRSSIANLLKALGSPRTLSRRPRTTRSSAGRDSKSS
jgi:hypothetical protein